MREGVWGIVNGTETLPEGEVTAETRAKFQAKLDKALAIIVLAIEPSLLYLIGDPESPVTVWRKLADQFQKKTWANKLALRRKLYSLRLKDGDSVQDHVKSMTEIFNELSVIGAEMDEEDKVVHLLASLPSTYDTLVTALEANATVPSMEVVTERLLHEERKHKDRDCTTTCDDGALVAKHRQRRGPKCHYCHKYGHIQRNCAERAQIQKKDNFRKERVNAGGFKHKANTTQTKPSWGNSSSDSDAGLTAYALSTGNAPRQNKWIVDSGATSHICNNERSFVKLHNLENWHSVTLGDGRNLDAIGYGVVSLMMKLPGGVLQELRLHDVLLVPDLSYNLLSVSKATEAGKTVEFRDNVCSIKSHWGKRIATAGRISGLYYLNCQPAFYQVNTVREKRQESKESTWHRRLGHLSESSLQKLAKLKMADGFDYDPQRNIDFCKSCIEGKIHRQPFPKEGGKRSTELLGLVHSDVCGELNVKSLGGAKYFLTFVDDNTRYVWTYMLKHKSEVFQKFFEWKALVENSSGHKLKALRTDNGGEYVSNEMKNFLKKEGVHHELTVPKTPEQNGVAERLNRTLVEAVRCMLCDSKLPQCFWAEAVSTAVYLRNRSPTKAVDGSTPIEAWTGEKPRLDHLRRFGCAAFAHIPKDERRKLDSKAKKCILVGYGVSTKGYRLYDFEKKRAFFSRDVVFNEEEDGLKKEINEVNSQHSHHASIELSTDKGIEDRDGSTDTGETGSTEEAERPQLRRSTRERRPPDYYGEWVNVAVENDPTTRKEALAGEDKEKWKTAMEKEMQSMQRNEVWDLVKLPQGRKPIGCNWVFKRKVNSNGVVERCRARLVTQGFTQKYDRDYEEKGLRREILLSSQV